MVLSSIFWGLIVLSLLVFVHEAGHFIAARLCGFRVTEFFLGMPCRIRLAWTSKRFGTEFGITPLLLGGYNRICGMETNLDPALSDVLQYIMKQGSASVLELSKQLNLDSDRIYDCLTTLLDWASIEPCDATNIDSSSDNETSEVFQTVNRDAHLLSAYDYEHDFTDGIAYPAGSAQIPEGDFRSFFEAEKSRTYVGGSYFKRVFVVIAGPFVNFLLAFAIMVSVLSLIGVEVPSNDPVVGAIQTPSIAQSIGMQPGDTVVSVAGHKVNTFEDLQAPLKQAFALQQDFNIEVLRNGKTLTLNVSAQETQGADKLGVYASKVYQKVPFTAACVAALKAVGMVFEFAARLLIPTQTLQVLNSSSSVVGISVMASRAAEAGLISMAVFIANISMSLCVMNLLPIPPLDGGRLVIETLGALRRKPLSTKAQTYFTYAGLAFVVFIFIYSIRLDVLRLILGS